MDTSDTILYTTPAGDMRVEVYFEGDTFWLPQKRIADLFGVVIPTVNYHLKEIFKSAELQEDRTIRKFRIVQIEGQREVSRLHWAMTRPTAAELIAKRADVTKPNIGLTTWKNAPDGKILKSDVTVAKNHLSEKEVSDLNRIVTMYLDYAENQAARQIPMKMTDWMSRLDAFLQFNEYELLKDAGNVSHKVAQELAAKAYDEYRVIQDRNYESDFDRQVQSLKKRKP